MSNPTPRKRGCLFYGCLTTVILVVIGGLLALWLVRAVPRYLADRFSSPTRTVLPESPLSREQFSGLTNRAVQFFGEQGRSGGRTLEMTGDELNALIQRLPDDQGLQRGLHLEIQGDELIGTFSLPVDRLAKELGWDSMQGRFLNGRARLKVRLEAGQLHLSMDQIEINGQPAPGWATAKLQGRNLAAEIQQDPRYADWLKALESVEIANGKLVLRKTIAP